MTIVVFAKEGTVKENVDTLKKEIDSIPNVVDIEYKSKEDLKNEMKRENETYKNIIDKWGDEVNPLPDSFIITVEKIEDIKETASTIQNLEHVDAVRYGEGVVENLVDVFGIIRNITIVAVIALIFVTAFLISNTIKITIYSRKNEIDIMRLVGTSNTVIRLPFLFEGLFLGVIGSIIPVLCTIYGYVLLYDKMGGVLFTDIMPLISPYNFVFKVSGVLIIIGALVGMYGSYKSVRKYLKI